MTHAKELTHTPIADGMFFGESPRYQNGLIYLSDMTGRAIYTINPASGEKKKLCHAENQPNGMCFAPDGSLIWSSMFDKKLYRRDPTGATTLYADLSHLMTGYCGDMAIDIHGRVYQGDTGARVLHGELPRPGRLLIIETEGSVHVAEENITFGYGLLKWDVGANGRLSNRQKVWSPAVVSPTGQTGITPDGMFSIDGGCMDAEGGMWLSLLGLEKFVRVDQQGIITHEIRTDGHATACTLGGEDG
ncbi:hypothetical protein BJX96DRAFT_180271 [Aspergillus floccosus]